VKLAYDAAADALYLTLDESPPADTQELRPGIIADLDAQGRVVGIEILNLRKQFPGADLNRMQLDLAS
jgi:uncharacterized protein YuzE